MTGFEKQRHPLRGPISALFGSIGIVFLYLTVVDTLSPLVGISGFIIGVIIAELIDPDPILSVFVIIFAATVLMVTYRLKRALSALYKHVK